MSLILSFITCQRREWLGSWWEPVSYNLLGTSFHRSRDAFCPTCDMPQCRESFLFISGSSCLSDREIRRADVKFLSGIHLLMEFLSFFHSIHVYEVPTMSPFNSNLSLLAEYVSLNKGKLSTFSVCLYNHYVIPYPRQPGRVCGWLIIL